ncbi:hypothetical protein NC653_036473 [Populus alba x Populus x berolinensis]|uniref:Uncharacterized protein n=1 Tax=Populus alba x Populus x berolinensis TaxID=444605 RepID=A0AAD6LJV0_9ROSI|nr:hypothetical protein NC653_036473 [Populus alba x Populus x berolinensis]
MGCLTSMILYRSQHSRIKLTTVKFSYKLSYLLRKHKLNTLALQRAASIVTLQWRATLHLFKVNLPR